MSDLRGRVPWPRRHLRPLRGSHLVFPADVLPITHGFGFMHPADNRSVFVVPWEGAILVGTTDLDHAEELVKEPTITEAEVEKISNDWPIIDDRLTRQRTRVLQISLVCQHMLF